MDYSRSRMGKLLGEAIRWDMGSRLDRRVFLLVGFPGNAWYLYSKYFVHT